MDQRERPANFCVAQGADPAAVQLGRFFQPGADGLDDQHVRQAGDDDFPADAELACLGGHVAHGTLHPLALCRWARLDAQHPRQHGHKVRGSHMFEAHRAADEVDSLPTALEREEIVSLADRVQRALGRPPRDFRDYARAAAASGVWDVPACS